MNAPKRIPPLNFVDQLRSLALGRPQDTAMIVVSERDGATLDRAFTYADLDQRARALAALLQHRFDKGDRALLMLDNDEHYVVAFFACLYAGLVAVPLFPPESARQQHLERLAGIAVDAQACCILTVSGLLDLVSPAASHFAGETLIAVDCIALDEALNWIVHSPVDEDIAFLQYTSGSTSTPKGVVVSHGNLMANERAIKQALSIDANDIFVSWLPLFHDMGLIGGLLQPFYSGLKLVLMAPRYFLERPVRWLQTISRHGGTVSGGPDFAYRLCLERVKTSQLAELDLSSWRVAFSGAEPVRYDTLQGFTEFLSSTGFRPSSPYPCYGLAEATLMVTACRPNSGVSATAFALDELRVGRVSQQMEGRLLVNCGRIVAEHQISIRDTATGEEAGIDKTGEIWVSGPSITQGYWNKPAESAETFVASGGRRWLRTGDLGFIREGQLYVAGRIKDLIIVRGHNLYPQDIEQAIESEVEAVRKGRVAAFAVESPAGEGVGVAVEISRGLQKLLPVDRLVEALGTAVGNACGEPLLVVALLNPGALPKTSSGKLQRRACHQRWLTGTLDAYALYQFGRYIQGGPENPQTRLATRLEEHEKALAAIWADVLRLKSSCQKSADGIRSETHFFAAGGNSLAATQVAALIEARCGIAFPARTLFEFPRLGECAAEFKRRLENGPRLTKVQIPQLPRADHGKSIPLSYAQQRQWFLWELDPSGTAYHIQGALRLSGTLDEQALSAAVDGLIQRHESLRTSFVVVAEGEVVQRVQPTGALTLQFMNVDSEARAAEALRQLGLTPFDLTAESPVRVVLLRLAENCHILAIVMHHIISDGVSMGILLDDLVVFYEAALDKKSPSLEPLPIQYRDFAEWQPRWLAEGERERQLAYWRGQLGDEHPRLTLPVDHPRLALARYGAAHLEITLPDDLSRRLRQVAESAGATLYMVLLTGLQILLHRYTGQEDIRVGAPVANRNRAETQRVVGLFVNTVVLSGRIRGRLSLADALAQLRESVLSAQANQDLPFEQLVDALQPDRSLSHNPLFQVMFNHLREDYRILRGLPELAAALEPVRNSAAQFELTLDTREDAAGRVRADFVYAAELFEPATMARLAEHYLRILTALAEHPEQAIGDIELLSECEKRDLSDWGDNLQQTAAAQPVHHLFERQAAARPDGIALIFNDCQLTYAELNERANRLAHHLIGRGVKPDHRIGVAMERSIEMVVALLGIMKAGGAYVPLDPEHPAERIRYVMDDSRITLLLTQKHLQKLFSGDAIVPVIHLDTVDLSLESHVNPAVSLHNDHLVYLIYTSGSTGRPKGAANSHGALCNRLRWGQLHQPLDATDTVIQKTPFSFDISFWEFFWPLATGARLLVAGPGDHRDPSRLRYLVDRHQVTTIHFVPSMLQASLDHEEIRGCRSIRRIICSGEALPADLQKRVFDAFPQVTLHNLYGPTEAAIEVTYWDCPRTTSPAVPIGRPIAGLQTFVLDPELNLVPRGVPGELYLGGVGLARGYWQRSGLTSERFVAASVGADGGRLYRTGDLVRWNREGQLEYLGRIDHQIKIRGFRVELGEVEAVIREQSAVREAVVVAHVDKGSARLVAYVSPERQEWVDVAQLNECLRGALPDYMVPSAIVVLDSLPLNFNGKVDRKALPAPTFAERPSYEAPAGQIAEGIAAVWVEVLGIERAGIHDSFFELGGHSLLLMRIHRLLEQRLAIRLSIVDLFQYPTIGALAARIENVGNGSADGSDLQEQNTRAMRRRAALAGRRRTAERVE